MPSFLHSNIFSSPSSSSSPIPAMKRAKDRPMGLWKARVTPRNHHAGDSDLFRHHHHQDSDSDDEFETRSNYSNSSNKRLKLAYSEENTSEEDLDEALYLDYSRQRSTPPPELPKRESCWTRRTRIMDTSSTAARGSQTNLRTNCDFEDWEDLKDLFNKAAEQYEGDDASEALPLLRGVVHECHRFLIYYQDPSVLFSTHPRPTNDPPEQLTPPDERHVTDWDSAHSCCSKPLLQPRRKCKCVELPTAFHAILGTALFLFGNLIAQNPTMALSGEPDTPTPYWLAALDVFETGENLPSRVSGYGCEAPEDWRMAIVWGRTLVCIADETLTRDVSPFNSEEPIWPEESPFSAIAQRRPPVTRRMSLAEASANDLMILAMDQFSRGIFHMPHQAQSGGETFSRAKELFTIASEVLLLAEKMNVATERQYWASWADSVFNQMKMEADMDVWRGPITRARGRCWLTVGSARVEELEDALEKGDTEVLRTEEAEEAREGLTTAVEFFERAKAGMAESEWLELRPLMAEALLTLANLTEDEERREALYARAQTEGGLDLDEMDCD